MLRVERRELLVAEEARPFFATLTGVVAAAAVGLTGVAAFATFVAGDRTAGAADLGWMACGWMGGVAVVVRLALLPPFPVCVLIGTGVDGETGVARPFFCRSIVPSLTNFSFHCRRMSSARKPSSYCAIRMSAQERCAGKVRDGYTYLVLLSSKLLEQLPCKVQRYPGVA